MREKRTRALRWLLFTILALLVAGLVQIGCLAPPEVSGLPCKESDDCLGLPCNKGKCGSSTSDAASSEPSPDTKTKEQNPSENPDQSPPKVSITAITGDGTKLPISPKPEDKKNFPSDAKASPTRIQKALFLTGENLDKLDGVKLVLKDDPKTTFTTSDGLTLETTETDGTLMKRKMNLPKNIVAGLFILYGIVGQQEFVLANTYILQGERGAQGTKGEKGDKGDKGEKGTKGDKGTDGTPGLSCAVSKTEKDAQGNTKVTIKCGAQVTQVTINKGEKGAKGDKGTDGKDGKAGSAGQGFSTSTQTYIKNLQTHLKIDATKKHLTFTDANVQVVNGMGHTERSNGRGNLIIGYNATRFDAKGKPLTLKRTGSHYIVVGNGNEYTSFAGVVFGLNNTATGHYASVLGGIASSANSRFSSVLGGNNNHTHGEYSAISGGSGNRTFGIASSISGGAFNIAGTTNPQTGVHAHVAGGNNNTATANNSSVLGGSNNNALQVSSTIVGGKKNITTNLPTAANSTTITNSVIVGGQSNKTIEFAAVVVGGESNEGNARLSAILGGKGKKVTTALVCLPVCK